jgi:uncharacterized protein
MLCFPGRWFHERTRIAPVVARDDLGYVLRIAAHTPPRHPWFQISARLAQALTGYERKDKIVSRVGIFTPRHDMGSLENPLTIARGEADVAFTNPPLNARFAMEGRGPYTTPIGVNLRAIARFPEPDYMLWMVAEETGITSMRDIAERRIPLRVVSGRLGPDGPDPLSFLVEEVMRAYGFGQQQLESWGGKVIHAGNTIAGVPVVKSGQADALFQEAAFGRDWDDLVETRRMRLLRLDEDVIQHIEQTWGFPRAWVPQGRFPFVEEKLPTLAYAGWLLFSRDDLPDDLAYVLAKTCVEERALIEAPYRAMDVLHRGMEVPLTPRHLCSECVIPLHPAAEAYYREIGALGA